MPTLSNVQDDIRILAEIDMRHRFLSRVKDGWFARTGFVFLSERAVDGTPLVGVALKHPAPCPIDKTATVQIKYWVANLGRDDLGPAFKKSIAAINDEMAQLGAERVWGLVPKTAEHLVALLDPIAEAAKCVKTDGAEAGEEYAAFHFYVGNRTDVNDLVQRRH